MKIYTCKCGQPIFFDNSQCLSCKAELGFCPACKSLVPLINEGNGQYQCGNTSCGIYLAKCSNYLKYNVCNRCVAATGVGTSEERFCDCCRYNQTIPDLSVEGNLGKWYRLEMAKRRLFYDLDLLKLPHGTSADGFDPPLSFDFKADVIPSDNLWRSMGEERVYTGHANGHITINIREADEVERERLRVDMGEAHRTLIGHFRHEIGHYYWDVFFKEGDPDFSRVFGDPHNPDYGVALNNFYENGPPSNWPDFFVSAYATMHPWEDWAETFAMYLDMVSALETAVQVGLLDEPWFKDNDFDWMAYRFQKMGTALNEMSRTLGLLDMAPVIIAPPVVEKLRFVHLTCRQTRI